MLFARRDARFFDPLRSEMDLLTEASRLLWEGAQQGSPGMKQCSGRIDELRLRIGELDAGIVCQLRRTLITPIDPEDILNLSHLMRKLLDNLARAASRQEFCPCQPAPQELIEELKIIHQCSLSLKTAFGSFRNGALPRYCDELNELRQRADRIAHSARATVFQPDRGPIAAMQLRETYDLAEIVLNRYMALSETLKRIKLKNG